MKILSDLFPVILFFATYWLTKNMFMATGIAIAATVIVVALTWFKHKKVDAMQWVSLGLIVVMGGATLIFHDKHFIMWKPTLLYWIMAAALFVGQLMGKNGMKAVMGKQMELPDIVWKKLNIAWVLFMAFMGGLNIYIAYHFSEEIWVNFKLFGGFGLLIAFVIGQTLFLSKYLQESR